MNAVAQFNQLGGKTVTRKSLIALKELAYLEGSPDIIIRIDTVLNSFPEAEAFVLEVVKPAFEIGLGAAQHSGLYREALDDCGRLQKGYKFENGYVVKVSTGEADKKKFKKVIEKKEVIKEAKKASNYGKKRPFEKKTKIVSILGEETDNAENFKINFLKKLTLSDYDFYVSHNKIDEITEIIRTDKNVPKPTKIKGTEGTYFLNEKDEIYIDDKAIFTNGKYELYKLKLKTFNKFEAEYNKFIEKSETTTKEKGFDFIYEVSSHGYYIKTFLELPESRSVKFKEVSTSVEGLRYYNVTVKGLDELKAKFNGKYGDKNNYGSEALFNPNEKPSRTKKTASNYGKKKQYESKAEKYPFSKEDVPYETAYRAYSGISFSAEKRAVSEQNSYYNYMKELYDENYLIAKEKNEISLFKMNFARYKSGYLKRLLAQLYSKSRVFSTMITGGSNFPVRQMEKRNRAENNKLNELIEYSKKSEKIILNGIVIEKGIIKTGSDTALEQLQEKLRKEEEAHKMTLSFNKIMRKKISNDEKIKELKENNFSEKLIETAKKDGFFELGSYVSSNRSARMRELKRRIKIEENLNIKAAIVPEGEITFDGGTIVDDYSDNRIKILFDSIPSVEIRSFIKKGGQAFKWSPKNKAWQRQLNTYYSGSRNDLYKFLGVKTPEPPKKKVSDEGGNDPEPKTSIITDPSQVIKIKESISEGEAILKSGKFNGKKKTFEELQAVLRSVNNSRKKIGLPPTAIEAKEKRILVKKLASNIESLEISKITLDPKRFQNRSKLNQDIVNNIVNNFNETELDPLILWNNKGKNYLLAGHHRYEGLRLLKKKTAPVKFFTGTEAEAVEFAKVKSNSNRSLETPIERAKIYREMNGTKKAVEDKAKEIEGKNASTIFNLAALNPNGIILQSLENLSSGDVQNQGLIKNIADWVGDARRTYSSLTNAHEKEMFEFLMDKEQSKRITTKADFKQKIYAIAGAFDFEPTNALNLKRFKYQTEGEKVYNDEFTTLKNKIAEKINLKADLLDRLSNVKRQDFIPEDDNSSDIAAKKLAEMTAEISRLQKQLIELSQNKGTYTSAGQNQAALFGAVPEPYTFGPESTNLKPTEPQPKPTPQKAKNGLMDMEFDSLTMDEGWENLIQDPARNMKIAIWGKPKNGKTSGALQLANYLTKFGNVIYNFVDQGFNKSTKDLWINSGLANKQNATPSDITSSKDLEKELKTGKHTFCFIDMISDWIRTEKMKPEEFKERFMRQFPEVSFILIFEVTKGGDFKGDQGWTHLVDAIMTVEDFIIENRGRYGMGEKCVWDEGAKKFNPKRYAELFGNSESEEENIFNEGIEVL